MNPIVVEHVFVTPLQNAQALQLLGQILKARSFEQEGPQELDPARPDWTVVRYRRGLSLPAKVRAIKQLPHTFRIEWDRGRFSFALSIDPFQLKSPLRENCATLLLRIAQWLEEALTGARSADEVFGEWGPEEDGLVLAPGAAGRQRIKLPPVPIEIWLWCCLAACGLMVLWSAVGAPVGAWMKMILVPAGAGAGVLLWLLKTRKPPVAVERARVMSCGLVGISWSLVIAATYLAPQSMHRARNAVADESVQRPSSGPQATRVETRMIVLKPTPAPTQTPTMRTPSAVESNVRTGKVVDLLSLIDVQRDAVSGVWQMDNGALMSDRTAFCRIQIPYKPPEQYDFRIRFTRTDGEDAVVQICTAPETQFIWEVDAWAGTLNAFSLVRGIDGNANPTTKRTARKLINGQEYTSVVKVRRTGVKAYLDGRLVGVWGTNYADMSIPPTWPMRRADVIGVGSFQSTTRFRTIELIEVTGEGQAVQ